VAGQGAPLTPWIAIRKLDPPAAPAPRVRRVGRGWWGRRFGHAEDPRFPGPSRFDLEGAAAPGRARAARPLRGERGAGGGAQLRGVRRAGGAHPVRLAPCDHGPARRRHPELPAGPAPHRRAGRARGGRLRAVERGVALPLPAPRARPRGAHLLAGVPAGARPLRNRRGAGGALLRRALSEPARARGAGDARPSGGVLRAAHGASPAPAGQETECRPDGPVRAGRGGRGAGQGAGAVDVPVRGRGARRRDAPGAARLGGPASADARGVALRSGGVAGRGPARLRAPPRDGGLLPSSSLRRDPRRPARARARGPLRLLPRGVHARGVVVLLPGGRAAEDAAAAAALFRGGALAVVAVA